MFTSENPESYDLIVPLGQACSCTTTLIQVGVRREAYPFDWLSTSDLSVRVNFVVDDFKNWLEKEDLEHTGNRESPLPCKIFKNVRSGIVFNHDFPLSMSLDESFPSVKEKYNRRISRLYSNIKTANKVLFVYIEIPDYIAEETFDSLAEKQEKLAKKFPDRQIDLLYFYCEKGMAPNDAVITQVNPFVRSVRFDYMDYSPYSPPRSIYYSALHPFFTGSSLTKKKTKLNAAQGKRGICDRIRYKIYKHLKKKLLRDGVIQE